MGFDGASVQRVGTFHVMPGSPPLSTTTCGEAAGASVVGVRADMGSAG
jgi:hypothetical protein